MKCPEKANVQKHLGRGLRSGRVRKEGRKKGRKGWEVAFWVMKMF
jgi:hypothetical protein